MLEDIWLKGEGRLEIALSFSLNLELGENYSSCYRSKKLPSISDISSSLSTAWLVSF